ncbi:MAG TPA: dCTP deaminase, partial [Candidatus Dojkabacteria bacterium]|nr:dCTP deaminase [Candidatus Dojkabacteria bacterium]
MVLSKKHIIEKIKSGEIQFEPMIDGFQLQPHSVDLRLGYDFHIPRTWELTKEGRKVINIDPFSENNKSNFDKVSLNPGQSFEILPKEYIIATTLEVITIKSKELMAILFPRSSVNRRGLAVDLSGIIDVGYHGKLMIPIVNNTHEQIIKIYPGERICQIIFEKISSQI